MKYLMMICTEHDLELSPEQLAELGPATEAWVKDVDGRGVRLTGERLRPVSDATTVRVRDGRTLVSDGPFAETKEQICGFDVIQCADLDEALDVAAAHPMARYGTIEVRPFWEL